MKSLHFKLIIFLSNTNKYLCNDIYYINNFPASRFIVKACHDDKCNINVYSQYILDGLLNLSCLSENHAIPVAIRLMFSVLLNSTAMESAKTNKSQVIQHTL